MTSSLAPGGQPTDEVPLNRRSTELWMMLLACGIVVFAFLNVVGSLKDQHLSTVFEYMVAFLVIVLGAHLAVRLWACTPTRCCSRSRRRSTASAS